MLTLTFAAAAAAVTPVALLLLALLLSLSNRLAALSALICSFKRCKLLFTFFFSLTSSRPSSPYSYHIYIVVENIIIHEHYIVSDTTVAATIAVFTAVVYAVIAYELE